jgi:hypothetical protein
LRGDGAQKAGPVLTLGATSPWQRRKGATSQQKKIAASHSMTYRHLGCRHPDPHAHGRTMLKAISTPVLVSPIVGLGLPGGRYPFRR